MQCVECSLSMTVPALVIAMEQREHFALQRNAEACADCSRKMFPPIERLIANSRFRHQSMQCAACGNTPIMRLRFEIERCHAQVALCQPCYGKVRDDLLRAVPNTVSFLEKEWQTGVAKTGKRLPWDIGTRVCVKKHVPRFHDQVGRIIAFRGLLQPWYGYEVQFPGTPHHFFHERDLDVLPAEEETSASQNDHPEPTHAATPDQKEATIPIYTGTPSPDHNVYAKTPSPDRVNVFARTPSPDRGNGYARTPSPDRGNGYARTPSPDKVSIYAKTPSPDHMQNPAPAPSQPEPPHPPPIIVGGIELEPIEDLPRPTFPMG